MRNLILLAIIMVVAQVLLNIAGFLPVSIVSIIGCIVMGFILFSLRIFNASNRYERQILSLKALSLGLGFYMFKVFMQNSY